MKKVLKKLIAMSFFFIIYLMFTGTSYSTNWSAPNSKQITSPPQSVQSQAPPEPAPPPSSAQQLPPPKPKEKPKTNEKSQQSETDN